MTDYREHIVKSFDDEISNVVHLVTQMATLVEEQYKLLYHVIDTGSPATTEDILENEPKLDNYDAEIRDAVITLITLRSPVAVDLRDVLTSLKISTDLERLGDYAKNIAMRVSTLEEIPDTAIKNDILRLLNLVQVQLKKVIDAYVSRNVEKAKEVIKSDIEIDKTYDVIYEKIVDMIKGKVSKLRLLTYTKLLFAIKTLERAGDHIENVALVSLLEYNITSAGFKFEHSINGYEGMMQLQKVNPDLILLDWMLPDIAGTEICKFVRSKKDLKNIPIIMLTAKGEEEDLLSGFDMGCDDYITKPFSPAELIARIKALLRRANTDSNNSVLTYGNIKMDTGTHRVYCCDQEAKLGPREYRILEFLMRNPGRVYSRQQILDSVWGTNVYVTDRTIDVHIRRLRKALSSTEECKVIRTIRSSGYSLDSQS